jgi:hypothetical protein
VHQKSIPAMYQREAYFEFPVGELMRVEDGKVALVHVYYDGATLMRQLGVFSPRPKVLGRILIYQAKKVRSWVRHRR